MMQPSGQRLRAAQRPAAGGAQQQLCGGVYGCQTHLTAARDCDGAKAPARGGGRAQRGGGQARLHSAQGGYVLHFAGRMHLGMRWSEGPAPHTPRGILTKKKKGVGDG